MKKNAPDSARNKALRVAQFANARRAGPTKAEKNLAARIKDYDLMKAAREHENGPEKRMERGYHKPGSLQ
jgi:hypothetical protein